MLFEFNKDTEKEVSSGVLIGYVLIGFAVVLVVAFIIFAIFKNISGGSNKVSEQTTTIEQTTDTATDETSEQ